MPGNSQEGLCLEVAEAMYKNQLKGTSSRMTLKQTPNLKLGPTEEYGLNSLLLKFGESWRANPNLSYCSAVMPICED